MSLCSCKKKAMYSLHTVSLCKDHYLEALEHSADFTFDAVEMAKSMRLPPFVLRKTVLTKAQINADVSKKNKKYYKMRRERERI